jgi:hypothetical protein
MENGKLIIILGIVAGIAAFALMITFIGQGNVREVLLYYPEKVEQTVIFEDVDDQVFLIAISGVKSEPNPTLISRTSFAYILTVINNGDKNHRLFIEGMNVQTDLLEPGQNDTITMIPTEEGIYNYYDKRERLNLLGKIQIKTVVPSDEFQGFLKDMI